ncbi:MAG: hypothetical protein LAQ69_49940 [Acidobacteriia bacterium]|nr:hypothetical protein [Terriglobia bacterium]
MRFSRLVGAWLVLAGLVGAQNLAPEVLLLARIKSHMREELAHVPNYTCLETIARFRKEPGRPSPFQGELKPMDTVRLEIVYADRKEWYGSPGDRNLSTDNPVEFIGSGMIGTGAFALTLSNVFEGAAFTYRGEDAVSGRKAAKYDFHLPQLLKVFQISILGGSGTVGEEGSFWADPQSLDLLRLESHADEIPPYLPLEEASTKVSYARTRIGDLNVLLAQQADLHMLETSGVESYDRIEFTHCRAFSTQSTIHFEPEPQEPAKYLPPAPPTVVLAPEGASQAVPALLPITVQLTTPITYKDTVGTLIEGRVSGDVMRKGKIMIPNGSVVRGRIRRLERHQRSSGGDFILGLEFTEVFGAWQE